MVQGSDTDIRPRKERKANADMRRKQLLDAARRSILTHGLARTTLATVAAEAGLSQGVAVFYFKSKHGLLTETLRDLYRGYEALWTRAIESESEPVAQLKAVIAADFSAEACGPQVLPLWFAFWGELWFSTQYAEVSEDFDTRRHLAIRDLWLRVLPAGSDVRATQYAEWMDTLTDGYWQRLHQTPGDMDREEAGAATRACLAALVPELPDGFAG
jgi:TetR/AcrR family transcriptional repressor of bet genes